MSDRFDFFVILAAMRTGSNFLEANLNALDGVVCHGEAFNPQFIGYPNRDAVAGVTMAERDADPARLLTAIRETPGALAGFRYFHDHDPRVLDAILGDPRCAKIVLTRNPLESYVSRRIAQATGQWKLTNVARRKAERAVFDPVEFEAHVAELQAFQARVRHALQSTGQTAFPIAYEDLQDLDVLNGLAAWLGVPARLEALDRGLKRQNPEPVTAKVANPEAIPEGIARLDRFDLDALPRGEPARGAAVPGWLAAARAPVLCLPLRGGPEAALRAWLAGLDGVAEDALLRDFTQGRLRRWMREHPGHRRIAVLRHPLARAHHAFCTRILPTGEGSFARIRRVIRRTHGLDLPEVWPDPDWDAGRHRAAFEGFLAFLKDNLAGNTNLRIAGEWCSQSAALEGMSAFAPPDLILREAEMGDWLPAVARAVGRPDAPPPEVAPEDTPETAPVPLAAIYDARLEKRAREIYARDYERLGFADWAG
ncbi:nodulation protein NodH [Rhodosalinus sediminis]|uniref:Nodulation protein NodH n=1 Tax=Rhodosalinus sediminis TaxID=1940533 RepID=A0A3D9BXQ5_9RHOB|nr:nodulation protein NodH [Rhodosalinus sediminis]REC58313.1 nodulation protein NodH [Rhodosalinus sediminis]